MRWPAVRYKETLEAPWYDTDCSPAAMHVEAPSDNLVIHGVEPPPYAEAVVGAPSRPPSRTNDRSPIGKLADWSAANAGGRKTAMALVRVHAD